MNAVTIKKALISTAATAALFAIAPAVHAGERTVEVRTSDLNLTRPSAQAELQQRIARAVRKVCRSRVADNATERQDLKRCEADAWAAANAQTTQRIAEHKAQRGRNAAVRLKLAAD
jgi:UrcA family protein